VCHEPLLDSRVLLLLPRIDADLAARTRAEGCPRCGGRLDVANYPRKPRGADELGDGYDLRASFCCAVDGCRHRRTPQSVRFLGRRAYLGVVVVLASALVRGPTKTSVTKLSALLGLTRRTLARWCRWWSTTFATSRYWESLRGRFVPAVEVATMPASVLSRIIAGEEPTVVVLLRLLAPISTRPGLEASAM
jgi:hypothetical protein